MKNNTFKIDLIWLMIYVKIKFVQFVLCCLSRSNRSIISSLGTCICLLAVFLFIGIDPSELSQGETGFRVRDGSNVLPALLNVQTRFAINH